MDFVEDPFFFSWLKKILVLYIEKVYTYLRFGGGVCISISELAQNPPPLVMLDGGAFVLFPGREVGKNLRLVWRAFLCNTMCGLQRMCGVLCKSIVKKTYR